MNQHSFHSLQGAKIRLKQVSAHDASEMHAYLSDEDVSRFIGWKLMHTVDETRAHIEALLTREAAGTHLYASIVLASTQAVIGNAMMFSFDWNAKHAEIGYVFHKGYWGKGYGTECVALMDEFAFGVLQLHKLYASAAAANTGSARILEKNGYQLEGRLKDHYFIDGQYDDALLFGKIRPGNQNHRSQDVLQERR